MDIYTTSWYQRGRTLLVFGGIMARRELLQTEQFSTAIKSRLTYNQATRLLSALASLGKDGAAMDGRDWVVLSPLPRSGEHVMKLTIRDSTDGCWSAFVVFADSAGALVLLYAAPGEFVSDEDIGMIRQALAEAVRCLPGQSTTGWSAE